MKKLLLFTMLTLTLSSVASAEVLSGKKYFKTSGKVDSFKWAPERYQNDFKYDVFYYVPKSIKDDVKPGALVFLHGGGGSTMNRQGSIEVVNMYIPDLKKLADEMGMVLVVPSANGLNWGGHTRGMLTDLLKIMRTDMTLDNDHIGLSGHSMGGMGITRNYYWTADEFAFFLPMAAGVEIPKQSEQVLNKVFNVPYVHLQGKKDHFTDFIVRCNEQLKRTADLEAKYNMKSKLEIIFGNYDHNYDLNMFRTTLKRLLKVPRDLYQKQLFGTILTAQDKRTENNITYDYNSEPRYFWVEAINSDTTILESIHFTAKIEDNAVKIELPVMPNATKELKIYLHSKMVDLSKDVQIMVNGVVIQTRAAGVGTLSVMDASDAGFLFEDAVTIKL